MPTTEDYVGYIDRPTQRARYDGFHGGSTRSAVAAGGKQKPLRHHHERITRVIDKSTERGQAIDRLLRIELLCAVFNRKLGNGLCT